ncbi:MAG: TonB-dependent receptor, partial [Bacteroidetes bacterium]
TLPLGKGSLLVLAPGYDSLRIELATASFPLLLPLQATGRSLEAVVISAYEQGERLLTHGGSLSVLTPRDFQRDPATLIAPILNRVPGLFMHSGTLSTNRITIRGIGARTPFGTSKIRAYLDDIPLTSGEGVTSIEDIDLTLLGRVEVIKGPASSLYGAGLGGTLLLQTPRPSLGETSLEAGGMAGSFGLQRGLIRYQQADAAGAWQLHYHQQGSDGFRENNRYDRQALTATGRLYADERASLSLFGTFIRLRAEIPSSLDSATFVDNPAAAAAPWLQTRGYEDYDRALAGASYRYQLGGGFSLTASAFGGFYNNYEVRFFNLLEEGTQSAGGRATLRWRGQLAGRTLQLTAGSEGYAEWYRWRTYQNIGRTGARGDILSDNAEARQYLNGFAQAAWSLTGGTILTTGLNLNGTQYQYADRYAPDSVDLSGDYAFPLTPSPRLALSHTLRPGLAVHGSLAHGFSPPSVSETLTPEGLINPDIQPETGWNYELGTRGRLLDGRLFVDLTLYRMMIRNLLVPQRVGPDLFVGRNAGRTRHDGLELSTQWDMVPKPALSASLFATYHLARYRFVEFVDEAEDVDYSGNVFTGVPPHTLNAGLDVATRAGLALHLTWQWVDGMPTNDANTVWSEAWQVINLRAGWSRDWWRHFATELYGGVNNLLDARYAAMLQVNAGGANPRYFYPGQPRHVYLGLRLCWQKAASETR